jgi:hypothetical protein
MPEESRDEYIERRAKWLIPASDTDSWSSMTLDGIYSGSSERIVRMIQIAYRRGVRRGLAAAWNAKQPIGLRNGTEHEPPVD